MANKKENLSSWYVNEVLVKEKIKEKYNTITGFAKASGIDVSSLHGYFMGYYNPSSKNLQILSSMLEITMKDLMITAKQFKAKQEAKQEEKQKKKEEQIATKTASAVSVSSLEKSVENVFNAFTKSNYLELSTKRVDESFEVINKNILTLANEVQNILNNQIALKNMLENMQNTVPTVKQEVKNVEEEPEMEVPEIAVVNFSKEELINGYNEEDSDDVFKTKIYAMADIYRKSLGLNLKQALKNVYRIMTNTYGICWEQESKDYKYKKNTECMGYINIVCANPMYKSIMYSILADKIS